MTALTRKQQEVWTFIAEERQRVGIAPSIREIQKRFAFKSTRSAFDYVKALIRKGYLKRAARTARGLQVMEPGVPLPRATMRIPVFGSIPAGTPEARSPEADDYITMD